MTTFDLRAYDARLMRWHNPDPYQEFHSPYCAMGNDWVNLVDPSGGSPGGPSGGGDPFGAAFRTVLNSIHLINQMRTLNSPERIIPEPDMSNTRYGNVLNNLMTNNSAFNNHAKKLIKSPSFDWYLTNRNLVVPGKKESGGQLGRTRPSDPSLWTRDRNGLPISGEVKTFLQPNAEYQFCNYTAAVGGGEIYYGMRK